LIAVHVRTGRVCWCVWSVAAAAAEVAAVVVVVVVVKMRICIALLQATIVVGGARLWRAGVLAT